MFEGRARFEEDRVVDVEGCACYEEVAVAGFGGCGGEGALDGGEV